MIRKQQGFETTLRAVFLGSFQSLSERYRNPTRACSIVGHCLLIGFSLVSFSKLVQLVCILGVQEQRVTHIPCNCLEGFRILGQVHVRVLASQVIMKVFGALVILLAGSFFTAACYAAYQAPKWSGKARPPLGFGRSSIKRRPPVDTKCRKKMKEHVTQQFVSKLTIGRNINKLKLLKLTNCIRKRLCWPNS